MKEKNCGPCNRTCLDCFFRDDQGNIEYCIFDPENEKEINFFDPACKNFELSESAEKEDKLENK